MPENNDLVTVEEPGAVIPTIGAGPATDHAAWTIDRNNFHDGHFHGGTILHSGDVPGDEIAFVDFDSAVGHRTTDLGRLPMLAPSIALLWP